MSSTGHFGRRYVPPAGPRRNYGWLRGELDIGGFSPVKRASPTGRGDLQLAAGGHVVFSDSERRVLEFVKAHFAQRPQQTLRTCLTARRPTPRPLLTRDLLQVGRKAVFVFPLASEGRRDYGQPHKRTRRPERGPVVGAPRRLPAVERQHPTLGAAEDAATTDCRQEGGDLFIHRPNGQIRDRDSYGTTHPAARAR